MGAVFIIAFDVFDVFDVIMFFVYVMFSMYIMFDSKYILINEVLKSKS